MATYSFVRFNRPEAQRLADLSGTARDLHEAAGFCEIALMQYETLGTDATRHQLLDALTTAALIRYWRALSTGVRERPPAELIAPEDEALHEGFKSLRDKWIAHSVNGFEETNINAYLVPPERGDPGIQSISVEQTRVMSLSRYQIQRLMYLARKIEDSLAALLKQENSKVLEFAQSLDPKPFYDQVDAPPKAPSSANPSKPRKRWK